jgi:nucleotide-binding universal stress UspA family protein
VSYKTILLHLDQSPHVAKRTRLAHALAQRMQAHLIGVATSGVSRFMQGNAAMGIHGPAVADPILSEHIHFLYQQADALLAKFKQHDSPVAADSFEARRLDDDDYGGLCLQARYSDLLVLGQPDVDSSAAPDLAPYVTVNGGRPVLVVPNAGQASAACEQILVAWDGRTEAARAVTAALPLLKQAKRVTVALFNPDIGPDGHGEEPGADIALFLARHGVKVDVHCETTTTDTGTALLSLATTVGADLLVMGCYGHSRLRELLVGGTTRTVLGKMTLPVLMAH